MQLLRSRTGQLGIVDVGVDLDHLDRTAGDSPDHRVEEGLVGQRRHETVGPGTSMADSPAKRDDQHRSVLVQR